jgi:hypothetical protein
MKRKSRKATASRQAAEPMVPSVQLETVIGNMVQIVEGRRQAVHGLIREPLAVRGEWDDPFDQNERSKTARQVHHVRRNDPLLNLHLRSKAEVTDRHIRSAEQFRDDYEIGILGARPPRHGNSTGSTAAGGGLTEMQMLAADAYRRARSSVGESQCRILDAVVLGLDNVSSYAAKVNVSEQVAKGYLIAALDRLADHYEPTTTGKPTKQVMKTC